MVCKYLGHMDMYELCGKGRSAKVCRDMANQCPKTKRKGDVSEFCWRHKDGFEINGKIDKENKI